VEWCRAIPQLRNRCVTVTFPLCELGEKCHCDESVCCRDLTGSRNSLMVMTGATADGEQIDIAGKQQRM
jgi:hypothetical protein